MLIAKVIGTVVATRKNSNLIGSKFMIVETLPVMGETQRLVAVDQAGAGIEDLVLVALGSAARMQSGSENSSTDAAIVGIIDNPEEIFIK
ncbi:MAG: EutN/CcmL family microcompartment protein [Firmicutes bacterium]|nr:EutN/CcmL family microcompartment protein [Bacillota bacterium]